VTRSSDGNLRWLGFVVTVIVHAAVAGAVFGMGLVESRRGDRGNKLGDDQYEAIEAGLARRSKTAKTKSKLPQKDMTQKVKPDVQGVAMDPDKQPTKKDDKPKATPDLVDPSSTFDKFRSGTSPGEAPDETITGDAEGSEWGTLDAMKGDPYVGELIGRMTTNPDLTVPSVVPTGENLETWGCVKLAKSGKIADREIPDEHKSKNRAFNRAVEERLKATTDMDKEAPAKLVGRWLCVPYKY
jgi:hypothetical protein